MQLKVVFLAFVAFACLQVCHGAVNNLYTLSDNRYNGLMERIRQASWSDQKGSIIKSATDAYGFNCSHIIGFLQSFTSIDDKILALSLFRDNIVDPNNKPRIFDLFNRTDDKQRAIDLLSNVTVGVRVIANPNDFVWNAPIQNKWNDTNFANLLKSVEQVTISTGRIKVAEVAIMKGTEVLSPEQLMMLFNLLPSYKDIITMKLSIEDRIVGISSEQMVTLLNRFSLENQRKNILESMQCGVSNTSTDYNADLFSLAQFIQGSLAGSTCQNLSALAKNFTFEEQKFAILESFTTNLVDIDNKYSMLDAFTFASNKERARKIIDNYKPNSFLFGAPSGKVVFVLDTSGSMEAKFNYNNTQSTRIQFMKNEFAKVLRGFNETTQFTVLAFSATVNPWSNTLVNATQTNINNAIAFANKWPANGGTNSYDSLKAAFNIPGVQKIYFLSDGSPSVGPKIDPNQIIADVRQWYSRTNAKIDSIGLLLGFFPDENKPISRNFMKMLSDTTGGTYRVFESDR